MTLIKAALVNAQFLGFVCIDFGIESTELFKMEEVILGVFRERFASRNQCLWSIMRYGNREVKSAQQASHARYRTHRNSIRRVLDIGTVYPWLLLARLNLDKFYSDMDESIIGAHIS